MCGIAVIVAYGADAAPVDKCELLAIRDAMVARGHDDAGLWLSEDRRGGLAYRRLSIIDLSPGGTQPMVYDNSSALIAYNSNIFKFQALRGDLSLLCGNLKTGGLREPRCRR